MLAHYFKYDIHVMLHSTEWKIPQIKREILIGLAEGGFIFHWETATKR